MTRTIGLKGGPELMAFLDQLPKKIERNVLRGALRAGANVVRDEARLNVPVKSGKLKRSIKVSTRAGDGFVKAKVKLDGPHAFLGTFIEYGVTPHFINAGDSGLSPRQLTRRMRRDGVTHAEGALLIGNQYVRGAVLHPGFPARPFLRPALDRRAEDVVRAVGAYLAHRLQIGDLSAPTVEIEE